MLIYANLLEGSKKFWEAQLAAQEVAHNHFGLGDGGDDDDDNSSHKVHFLFINHPNLFTFYVDVWKTPELWKNELCNLKIFFVLSHMMP